MIAPAPLTRDRVVKVADSLPCAPRVLTELQQLLSNVDTDIPQVTSLLRRDGSLTARIIRIANGVVFGRGDPVGSLEDALARVGFREVYRLTSTASLLQLTDVPLRFYPITVKALRENSLLCGLAMEELAGLAGLDGRTAYTAGLLRSVGRVVLDVTAQKDLRYHRPTPMGDAPLMEWELQTFGLTGVDAGSAVLRAWRFQADVFVSVRDQYLHQLPVDPLPMAKLLHVAVGVADEAGYGLPGCRAYVDEHGARAKAELELAEADLADAVGRAMFKFERMKELLG